MVVSHVSVLIYFALLVYQLLALVNKSCVRAETLLSHPPPPVLRSS